jgi:hypothetical protein
MPARPAPARQTADAETAAIAAQIDLGMLGGCGAAAVGG